MYLILVYDIDENRVSNVMKICRMYLHHIQNSVFEGSITSKNFKELKASLNNITKDEDSIIIFRMRSDVVFKKEIIGKEKVEVDNIFFSEP